MFARPKYGRCCAEEHCQFPDLQLRAEHTCPVCKKTVHVLCGEYNGKTDKHVCFKCSRSEQESSQKTITQTVTKITNAAASYVASWVSGSAKDGKDETSEASCEGANLEETIVLPTQGKQRFPPCKACGGVDHRRKSSAKCPFYRKNRTEPALELACTVIDKKKEASCKIVKRKSKRNAIINERNVQKKGQKDPQEEEDGSDDKDDRDTPDSAPTYIDLGSQKYEPVCDASRDDFSPVPTIFKINADDESKREATARNIVSKYFNETLMEHIVDSSNKYLSERKKQLPHLKIWTNNNTSAYRPITSSCIYHFIALIYYFGLVKLPSKRDYWNRSSNYMPIHPIAKELGMNRDRFLFLWRHIHIGEISTEDIEPDEKDDDDDDEKLDQTVERVQQDQEEEVLEKNDGDMPNLVNASKAKKAEESTKVWFHKLQFLVNHVREVSFDLTFVLGTLLSLDEMMIRYCSRSLETHRIKNKPIGEGYKFFALTTSDGFVANFTPDGRSASKTNRQEYEIEDGEGKIEAMISFVTRIINRFRKKQEDRMKNHKETIVTRGVNDFDDLIDKTHPMKYFCLALDNYFTLPKAIFALREQNIGVIGTARGRRNWPPSEIACIEQKSATFNDFYYCVDQYGTLVAKWMDNGLVLLVSTLHIPGKNVVRARKRPRVTIKNKNHVSRIWGNESVKKISIPKMIDDYNHWMGGVDLVDQRISYYHADLRCYRNWMPMFLQILSIIRNNSFIVHRHLKKDKAFSHKKFTYEIIEFLMRQAHQLYSKPSSHNTRKQKTNEVSTKTGVNRATGKSNAKKKRSFNMESTSLLYTPKRNRILEKHTVECISKRFPNRFHLPLTKHIKGKVDKRGGCVMCTMQYYDGKKSGSVLEWDREVRRTATVCLFCSGNDDVFEPCYLCKEHYDKFHERTCMTHCF